MNLKLEQGDLSPPSLSSLFGLEGGGMKRLVTSRTQLDEFSLAILDIVLLHLFDGLV